MSLLFFPWFCEGQQHPMLWKRSDFLSLCKCFRLGKRPGWTGKMSWKPNGPPKGEPKKQHLIQDDVLYHIILKDKAYLPTWMAYFFSYGFHVGKSKYTKFHGFFSVPFPGISLWKGSISPLKTHGIHRVSSVRLFWLVEHLALASAIVRKTTEIFQQLPVKPRTGGQALESYQMIYA